MKIKNNIELCHIPVVLLTALDSIEYNIEGFQQGADDYISKPFHAKVLESLPHIWFFVDIPIPIS